MQSWAVLDWSLINFGPFNYVHIYEQCFSAILYVPSADSHIHVQYSTYNDNFARGLQYCCHIKALHCNSLQLPSRSFLVLLYRLPCGLISNKHTPLQKGAAPTDTEGVCGAERHKAYSIAAEAGGQEERWRMGALVCEGVGCGVSISPL